MSNQYLTAFQDHQPALVAASNRARFESCMQAVGAQIADIEAQMAGRADDSDWWGSEDEPWMRRYRPYVVKDGVLQIPVKGVLLHDFPYALGGWATGYDYIWRAFERGMGDSNVKGIALVVDSPGGMVAGCFEMVDRMWGLKGKKPIRGYASESAYSAAYATISVADEITVSRTGGVGSIGVVTSHVDVSKMMADFGWVVTFIHAGKHKVDGNAYEALPADVKARIQARIDDMYGIFVSTVARNRGLEEQAVRDTEALTFNAPDSLSVGLADKIGAFDDALAEFTASLNLNEGDEQMADFTQAQYDTAVAAARTEGETAGKAAGMKEGATAERARFTAIVTSEEGKKRPASAVKLATKEQLASLDAASIADLLADMPEEKAEASSDEPASAGAGAPAGMFAANMSGTPNPEVGANGGKPSEEEAEDLALAQSFGGKKAPKAA